MRNLNPGKRLIYLIVGLWLFLSAADIFGQGCAMCYTSVSNSTEAKQAKTTLNAAILILLIPAAAMFTGTFLLAYRYRNVFNSAPGVRSTVRAMPPRRAIPYGPLDGDFGRPKFVGRQFAGDPPGSAGAWKPEPCVLSNEQSPHNDSRIHR